MIKLKLMSGVAVVMLLMILLSSTSLAAPSQNSYSTQDSYSMLVLYLTDGEWYVQSIRGSHNYEEIGNKLYMDGNTVVINNLNKAGAKIYPDQNVEVPVEWDEETQTLIEIPVTLSDLNLVEFAPDNLPRSQHIGRLIDVDMTRAKPALVRRWYLGETYDSWCLVSQGVVDMWIADTLNVNDWVIVSYIEEIPDAQEYNVTIVTGKVYVSW